MSQCSSVKKNIYSIVSLGCLSILFLVLPVTRILYEDYMDEIFIFTIAVWSISIRLSSNFFRKTYSNSFDVITLLGLFAVYNVVHYFLLGNSGFFEIDFWWRISMTFVLFNLVYLKRNSSSNILDSVILILFLRASLEIVISTLQYFEVINSRNTFFEISGTFTSTNYLAYSAVIGILISFHYILQKKRKSYLFQLIYLSIILSSLALIIYLKSRAAIVGVIIVLGFFIFVKLEIKKRLSGLKPFSTKAIITFFSIAVGVFFYYLYQSKQDSANGRLFAYKTTLGEILNKPILGNGLFTFEEGYNTAKANYFLKQPRSWNEIKVGDYIVHAMNDFLEIIYETGIIGLLFIILSFYFLIKKRSKNLSKKEKLGLSLLIFTCICAMLSTLITNSFFWFATILGFLLLASNTQTLFTYDKLPVLKKAANFSLVLLSVFLIVFIPVRIKAMQQLKRLTLTAQRPSVTLINRQFELIKNNGLGEFWNGLVLYKIYDKKKAGIRKMEEGIKKHKSPSSTQKLGLLYLRHGKLKKAEELFKFNVGNEPFKFQPRYDLASLQLKMKKYKEAKSTLEDLVNLKEKIPSTKVDSIKNIARNRLKKLSKY